MTASSVVAAIWIGLFIFWLIAAAFAKQTVRRQSGPERLAQLGLNVAAWYLLTHRLAASPQLNGRFVPDGPATGSIGVAIACAGAAFTVWARLTIGRNWSGTITVKQDHELMTGGPYAIVRHPIYAGLLLTLLGTAVVVGEWRALAALGLAFAAWRWKSLIEERLMTEQFGDAYRDYRRRVKGLIPFVL